MSIGASAASINVDFEEFDPEYGAYFQESITSGGFEFIASDSNGNGALGIVPESAPVGQIDGHSLIFMPGGGCCGGEDNFKLIIAREDGGVFDLNSLMISLPDSAYMVLGYNYTYSGRPDSDVQAYRDTSLNQIDNGDGSGTLSFDNTWNDLVLVTVHFDSAGAMIDNLNATVVPIPAAVWLFGSALAGLGWMRRKQTV